MHTNVTALPNSARLQLTAVSLAKGEYQVVTGQLVWRLLVTYRSDEKKAAQPESFISHEDRPLFVLAPGVYRLEVSHAELGDKSVENIQVLAGTLTDEVIYLGATQIDDSEENFHLNDDEDFNVNQEYERRLADRQSESKYGDMAAEIRQPDILGPDAGFEQAQQVANESGMQSHPLLANSPQFDGVDAKLNPNTSENVHAAEAQKDPELRPGAQPQPGPSTAPQFRPGGM